jgi:2-polyprenyl-3-methyl-5-hydroxy-6-metoxy-1,4-benzoquinol methylase
MEGFDARTFGDRAADLYDSHLVNSSQAPAEQISALASLCPEDGRFLDAGAGTGRVCIPMAKAGVTTTAVDVSEAMLRCLRTKAHDAGVSLDVHHADLTTFHSELRFDLIACLFNTFYMLGDTETQTACLASLREVLSDNGRLVVEVFNPSAELFGSGGESSLRVRQIRADTVTLVARNMNYSAQRIDVQEILLTETGIRLVPHVMAYLSTAQLDEMAAACGLRLVDRWADWSRSAWTPDAAITISMFAHDHDPALA